MNKILTLGVVFLAMIGSPAFATSGTWNGTSSGVWSNTGNWSSSPSPVPGTGDTATFNNAGGGFTTIDLGAGVTINTILFDTSSAAAYTIGAGSVGSQTLTLNNGGAITINSTVSNNELFNSNVVLGTDDTTQAYTLTNNGTGTLTIAGAVSGGTSGVAGTKTLTVAGTGNAAISGAISNGGASAVAVKQTGTGTLTLSTANSYTGATSITSGTLALTAAGAINSSAISVSGTTSSTESLTESAVNAITGSSSITLGGSNSGTNTVTLSKANNFTGAISFGNNANDTLILSDTGAVASASSLGLTAGTLELLNNSTVAFGGPTISSGTGTILVGNNGSGINNAITYTSGVSIAQSKTLTITGANGYSLILPTVSFASGASSISLSPTTANVSVGTITNPNTSAGTDTVSLSGSSTGSAVTSTISDGTGGALTKLGVSGTGTWTVSGANTYTGGTALGGASTTSTLLILGSSSVVTSGAIVTGPLGTGTLSTVSTSTPSLDDNGTAITVANSFSNGTVNTVTFGSTGSGSLTFDGTGLLTPATFVLGVNSIFAVNNTTTIKDVVSGAFNLTKSGTGTLVLSGANTYSGVTAITGGTLSINSIQIGGSSTPNSLGEPTAGTNSIIALGGELQYTGSSAGSSDRVINLTANSILDASGSATFALTGGITMTGKTFTLTLQGTGVGTETTIGSSSSNEPNGITKSGTGMWTIGAGNANVFNNGTLTVSANGGTLEVGGSSALYVGATGSWTTAKIIVKSGGTLAFNVGTSGFTATGSNSIDTLNTNLIAGGTASGGFESGSFVGFDTTGQDFTYNTAIGNNSVGGTVGLTKLGTNTLTLGGTETYTGATTVSAGTLNVTGSTASGSAVSVNAGKLIATGKVGGSVTVANGATLSGAGNGSTTGVTGAVTVAGGGKINLQDGAIGTLTTGNLTINTGSGTSLSFDIGAGSSGNLDEIAAGTLTVSGTGGVVINIGNVSGSPTLTNGTYSLITYTGTVLGSTAFNNFTFTGGASSLSLDGKILTLVNGATGAQGVELQVASGVTNGQYTLTTTVTGTSIVHANGGTTTLGTTIHNTGTTPQDTLNYSALTATASSGTVGSASGNTSGTALAQGATSSPTASQTYTSGATAGTVTVGNSATVTNTNDTGETPVATNSGSTISVYSGTSTWNTNGSGSWGTLSSGFGTNWGANQGSPGLDSGFTNTDTATFGSAATSGTATVSLNGASPSLNAITFNDSSASYVIAQGSSGSISLKGNGGDATVTDTAGTHTISAPVSLTTSTDINVASGQKLTFSGAISGGGTLKTMTGSGTTVLSNATGNSYTGGTTVSAGKLYVMNTSNSGTGSGAVGVSGSGSVLAGSGLISGAVTLSSGGSLYSGGVPSGTPTVGPGTGMTISNTLTVNTANLTFALGSGGSGTPYGYASPNTQTTAMSVSGLISFAGTDSVSLVDLTSGSLSLRQAVPYLLISSGLSNNSDFSGLVTSSTDNINNLQLDGNGFVMGVYSGSGGLTNFTTIAINQYGADGVTLLPSNEIYAGAQLYLFNGSLEVVPEPGTWALMLGGLALLVLIQRRKSKLS